jgi:small subunit ribosomal protein S16
MATKIRLQRRGKKGRPFFHIVIADSRAPRDGRFVDRIGTYNPLTFPASIELDFEKALTWYQTGAQPTETVRAILSYKGVLYKSHLLKGVEKGALTSEQAEEKFQKWINEKSEKINAIASERKQVERDKKRKRIDNETRVKDARNQAIAKKRASANLKLEEGTAAEEPKEVDGNREDAPQE